MLDKPKVTLEERGEIETKHEPRALVEFVKSLVVNAANKVDEIVSSIREAHANGEVNAYNELHAIYNDLNDISNSMPNILRVQEWTFLLGTRR